MTASLRLLALGDDGAAASLAREAVALADQLAGIDERLTPEVRSVLSVPGALAARSARGGTAPERVAGQLASLKALATEHADWAVDSPVAGAL